VAIPSLSAYQQRRPRGDYFADLPHPVRERARRWLSIFRRRWHGNLPGWRLGILIGQARRLARNPPASDWGRSMKARKGGYAVQRLYRAEGRHPTAKATRARISRRTRDVGAMAPGWPAPLAYQPPRRLTDADGEEMACQSPQFGAPCLCGPCTWNRAQGADGEQPRPGSRSQRRRQ